MVASTTRLAQHLQLRCHRDRRRAGETAWNAPAVSALRPWLEGLWEQAVITGAPSGSRNLLSARQSRYVAESVLRDLDPEGGLAGRPVIARLLLRGWELCRQWHIPVHDLAVSASNRDSRLFAEWAQRFETSLSEGRWIDAASVTSPLCVDLAAGVVELPAPVYLAGFDAPTAAERRLIATLGERGALGGSIAPAATTSARASRVGCLDRRRELDRAARWAHARLSRQPDGLVGVVVPDLPKWASEVRRRFLDTFDARWRAHDGALHPVNVDDGAPLTEAGLVHTALRILRLPDSAPDYREFGQLLRSPYIAGADVEATDRALLDLWLRDRKFQRIQPRIVARQQRAPIFARRLGEALDLRDRFRERREPAEWVALIDILLRCLGWPRGRELGLVEQQQLAAWQSVLQQFARLGEVTGAIGYRRARRLLEDMLQDEPLRPPHATAAVQILSPRDAAGHQFDALWIAGLSSATWPAAPRVDPLVPITLQRDRGVPESQPRAYRQHAVAALRRLIEASSVAVCSWPERDGEEEQVPSPLLDDMPELAMEQLAALDAEPDARAFVLASATQEILPLDAPPPVDEFERSRGGSRVLSLQSSCPARAFFELRLGAREMPAPPFALDAAWRGTLTHDALESLYGGFVEVLDTFAAPAASFEAAIAVAVDESLERHIPASHPLARTLRATERLRLVRLLREMVALDRARGAFVVAELEAEHEASIGPLTLRLRFDRVDRLADGRKIVFDYKTGREQPLSVWRGERPQEPQLPLYAAGGHADGVGFIWLQAAEVKISGLGALDLGMDQLRGARGFTAEQWPGIVCEWRRVLGELAEEYARGDCRIDLERDRQATGEYAMLTRRYELQWRGAE